MQVHERVLRHDEGVIDAIGIGVHGVLLDLSTVRELLRGRTEDASEAMSAPTCNRVLGLATEEVTHLHT